MGNGKRSGKDEFEWHSIRVRFRLIAIVLEKLEVEDIEWELKKLTKIFKETN